MLVVLLVHSRIRIYLVKKLKSSMQKQNWVCEEVRGWNHFIDANNCKSNAIFIVAL